MSNLQMAQRRLVRWRVLKILDAGRPYPVNESLVAEVLPDAGLAATQNEIRQTLQYLHDKKYVEVMQGKSFWQGRLLPLGVDFIEDDSIVDVGIARPVE